MYIYIYMGIPARMVYCRVCYRISLGLPMLLYNAYNLLCTFIHPFLTGHSDFVTLHSDFSYFPLLLVSTVKSCLVTLHPYLCDLSLIIMNVPFLSCRQEHKYVWSSDTHTLTCNRQLLASVRYLLAWHFHRPMPESDKSLNCAKPPNPKNRASKATEDVVLRAIPDQIF